MPKKSKSKSINRAQKREQYYIKNTVSDYFDALLCNLINYQLIICSSSYLSLFIFHLFTLKITQLSKSTYIDPLTMHRLQIYPKNIQVALSKQNLPPPKIVSKLLNDNTALNLNIASYFLNILASQDVSTWFTTGGPITKTVKILV